MPVYLFSHRAHSCWMPDGDESSPPHSLRASSTGATALPSPLFLQREHRRDSHHQSGRIHEELLGNRSLCFNDDHQRKLIDLVVDSQATLGFRCFGVSIDHSHLQTLVAWDDRRDPLRLATAIRESLNRGMQYEFGLSTWLAGQGELAEQGELAGQGELAAEGEQKRVRNRTQFDYLVETYFPKQAGIVWTRCNGFYRMAC
jgi:hypothetical protein